MYLLWDFIGSYISLGAFGQRDVLGLYVTLEAPLSLWGFAVVRGGHVWNVPALGECSTSAASRKCGHTVSVGVQTKLDIL